MQKIYYLLFLGVSLQTYYFYGKGGPLIVIFSLFIMGLLLFFVGKSRLNFPFHFSSKLSIWYLIILLWSIFGVLVLQIEIDFKRLFGFIIVAISSLISYRYFKVCSLKTTIKWYLFVNIIFFYIQFFGFYLFGFEIDYLVNITGEKQRMFGGSFNFPYFNSFIRPTGLYQEPGTYATFLSPFIALFGRYSEGKQNKKLYYSAILSLFLSFSTFGIIFGSIILLLSKKVRPSLKVIIGCVVSLISYPYIQYRFVLSKATDVDVGLGFRINQITETVNLLKNDTQSWFFGTNLLSIVPKNVQLTGAYNDSGLLLYLILFLGPILTITTIILIGREFLKGDLFSKTGIIILFLSKISIFMPFFPFIVNSLLWKNREIPLKGERIIEKRI